MGHIVRRVVRAAPKPKRHEIPAWVGAPLWAAGNFVKKHWKLKAWALSLVAVGYAPYALHTHASYKDNLRCDRINYAAQVAYQYGCTGRECSEDLVAYEQTVLMTYGALREGCHTPPPIRPDQAVSLFVNVARDALKEKEKPAELVAGVSSDEVTLIADAT